MTAMLLLSCGLITAVGEGGHGGITWGKPQKHAHHTQKEKTMARTQWASRVVTDTIGDAGAIVLDDESTAYDDLKTWIHDYYDVDDAEAECLAEHLTASTLTAAAREYAIGLFGLSLEFDSEWSAERSAEAIYEYMRGRGEPVTKGATSVSLGMASLALGDDRGEHGDEALSGAWWRCGDEGEGWITDEADVEIAAEYLRAVAGEN